MSASAINPWAWITALCDPIREEISAPCVVDLHGEPHTVATNGKALLFVPGEHGWPVASARQAQMFSGVIHTQLPQGSGTTFSLDALRDFLRCDEPLPEPCTFCTDGEIPCKACDGEGEIECQCECGDLHDRECPACRGSGGKSCSCRSKPSRLEAVELFGDLFDRKMIAPVLARLEGTEATWYQDGRGRAALILSKNRWKLVVMPMRPVERSTPLRVFPAEVRA